MKQINISGPSITQLEIDYVLEATRDGWYEKANYYVSKFEDSFAKYIGRKYAVALPSCTAAIHTALLALDIKEGDEVIIPDITWIATAAPVSYVGATPIFADIDKDTWCISTESIRNSITEKTKAIIVVDLYGNMPQMDEIIKIATENNLYIIEDSAEAIGSEYNGQKAGTFGICSTFSFHGSKTLTTGEGGMLVTDDEEIYKKALVLRDHGKDASSGKMFWNSQIAYKYKMSNIQAALGIAQLERVQQLINKKIETFEQYKKYLSDFDFISINNQPLNVKNTYWMNTVVLNPVFNIKKEEVIEYMGKYKIACRPFFYPLSSLPAYDFLNKSEHYSKINKVSYSISPYAVNLPSSLDLSEDDVFFVCEKLKEFLSKNK